MNFGTVLTATTSLWPKLNSRWARRVYLCYLAIVIFPAILTRVEAVIFERRAVTLTSELSTLRIGETSKADALARVPGLTMVDCSNKDFHCHGAERFSIRMPRSKLSDWAFNLVGNNHERLDSLLTWWGFRNWLLDAEVEIRADKVSHLRYTLGVSAPRRGNLGGVLVSVSSTQQLGDRPDWDLDESPDYQVSYMKFPTFTRRVQFTERAPVTLVHHAFDVHVGCLWSLLGCETASQLLPEAERDWLAIKQAGIDRAIGPDQCPVRILPHRARDIEDILLVKVTSADLTPNYYGTVYWTANFQLLRVLKGKPARPLVDVRVETRIYAREILVHNSAVSLLRPGQRILLFGGNNDIDEPCEAMAGTDEAVRTLEEALSENALTPKS